ncbi:MAG: hypothetical protein OEV66_10255 [Spirochaetia bacterium]|nr:hypothetical protein [Spirochaetia bacterium]
MPLFEVHQKYLKYQNDNELYRFIHDPINRISLHIWQDKKQIDHEGGKGITRFQAAMDNNIVEWKNGHLTYGQVDSGEDGFGIKKSPVMMMTQSKNKEYLKKLLFVLKDNSGIAGINFIIETIEKSVQSEN